MDSRWFCPGAYNTDRALSFPMKIESRHMTLAVVCDFQVQIKQILHCYERILVFFDIAIISYDSHIILRLLYI